MRTNREKISLAEWIVCGIAAMFWTTAFAEELKRDPTPQDYVERNGGGASVSS